MLADSSNLLSDAAHHCGTNSVRSAMNRLVRQLVGRTRISCIAPDTARDQVVSPALQASMVAAMPVRLEQTLDTGHAPFVTNPDGVAAAIEAAIRQ